MLVKNEVKLKQNPWYINERIRIIEELRNNICEKCLYRVPVPGPLTLYHFSHFEIKYSKENFVRDYINNVLVPLEKLLNKHKIVMEIHEPSITIDHNFPLERYAKCMNALKRKHFLLTYFGGVPIQIAETLNNKFIIGYDLVEGNDQCVYGEEVQLGVVDSRNTRMESIEDVVHTIKSIGEFDRVYLSTNTFLEFLPEKIAYKKMRLLGKIKKRLEAL